MKSTEWRESNLKKGEFFIFKNIRIYFDLGSLEENKQQILKNIFKKISFYFHI